FLAANYRLEHKRWQGSSGTAVALWRFPRLRVPISQRKPAPLAFWLGLLEVSHRRENFRRPIRLWDKKAVTGQFASPWRREPSHDYQLDRRPSFSDCARQPEPVY